jgi:spore germination protein GerM
MPKSYHEPRKKQLRPLRKRFILWGALVVLVFSVGLVIGLLRTEEATPVAPAVEEPSAPLTRDVILYFAAMDGQTLIAESRRVNECQSEEECLRDLLQELIAGPQSDLAPIFPSQVAVRGVTVADSLVNVDFSQELMTAHPGGTQSELLTIYGLADTVTVNFPHLRQVQVLVEGSPADTLRGHVDLRQPINPDFTLVKEGLVPVGNMNGLSVEKAE